MVHVAHLHALGVLTDARPGEQGIYLPHTTATDTEPSHGRYVGRVCPRGGRAAVIHFAGRVVVMAVHGVVIVAGRLLELPRSLCLSRPVGLLVLLSRLPLDRLHRSLVVRRLPAGGLLLLLHAPDLCRDCRFVLAAILMLLLHGSVIGHPYLAIFAEVVGVFAARGPLFLPRHGDVFCSLGMARLRLAEGPRTP